MKAITTALKGAVLAGMVLALAGCETLSPKAPPPQPSFNEQFVAVTPADQVAAMARGVNVLGGDPGWTDAAKARFTPAHFKLIHDAGFATVRIVLTPFAFMDGKGNLDPGWLAHLDLMVKAGLDAGLNVILDNHEYELCGKDVVTCRTKLNAFWTIVAPRYKDAPNRVIFEMLNEPHEALTAELWNAQLIETLAIIRASNPERNVIIGPGNWNGMEFLPKFVLPADDAHIIPTVHYYHPMVFTHQGAPWVPQYTQLNVTWGSPADVKFMNDELDEIKAWAAAQNRPVFLGEFGVYETAPVPDKRRWLEAFTRGAEVRGFAWAYWQFDHDFVLYDIDKGAWNEPILKALVPETK
jgi:endoglucanase